MEGGRLPSHRIPSKYDREVVFLSSSHHFHHLTSTGMAAWSTGGVSQSSSFMKLNHEPNQTILLSSIHHLSPEMEMEKKVSRDMRRRRRRSRRRKQAMTRGGEGAGDGQKGKMRKRLSVEQAMFLEKCFWSERKLESARKVHLASEAGLDPKQVVVWFQNRRARWKSKNLEDEYLKLKSLHNSTSVEKIHLQAEVINLKNQLTNALKEIQHLHSILNVSHCVGAGSGGGGGGGHFESHVESNIGGIGGGDEFSSTQLQVLNGVVEEHIGMEGFDLDMFDLFNGFV